MNVHEDQPPTAPSSHRRDWYGIVAAVVISVFSGAAIQFGLLIYRYGALGEQIAQLTATDHELETKMAQIDVGGSRNVPVLLQRVDSLERFIVLLQSADADLRSRFDRMREQIDRLETPLAKKVEGDEIAFGILRDHVNNIDSASLQRLAAIQEELKGMHADITTSSRRVDNIVTFLDKFYDDFQNMQKKPTK